MAVNNDFHDKTTIFDVFKDLEVDWDVLEKQTLAEPQVNGNHTSEPATNGAPQEPAQAAAAAS